MIRALFVAGFLLLVTSMTSHGDEPAIRSAVVKVWATKHQVNLSAPWKRGDRQESSGSGLWLGDNRILTNAHVVQYASQISVQPHESPERLPADVVIVSHEMDLAILKLDTPEAFAEVEPLKVSATTPSLRTSVQVYGYPEGGQSMSVTQGVVSRIGRVHRIQEINRSRGYLAKCLQKI